MPVHDWTKVDAGLFHAFHQQWVCALCDRFNIGVLPSEYFALVEQTRRPPIHDMIGLSDGKEEAGLYAARADHVAIRNRSRDLVGVVDIVSPGTKASQAAFRAFVEKCAGFIGGGVHLLVIDIFPPGEQDQQGIHKAIWDEFEKQESKLSGDKRLILVSYEAKPHCTAYVDMVAVGDPLPDMPLFLKPELYVPTPLETTYLTAWDAFPAALKRLLV
jgi:hypothetical protein